MASINLNINSETAWADLVEEEAKMAPAAAGASTPPPKEKGWTDVSAPKKGKKTKSRTKDTAPADPVAKTLDFGNNYADRNNKFAIFAEDDE